MTRSAFLHQRRSNTYTEAVLADNPLFFYRVEEVSGSTAMDSSTNGRHGTYNGTVGYQQVGSGELLSREHSVSLGNAAADISTPSLPSTVTWVIECWFWADSLTTSMTLLRWTATDGLATVGVNTSGAVTIAAGGFGAAQILSGVVANSWNYLFFGNMNGTGTGITFMLGRGFSSGAGGSGGGPLSGVLWIGGTAASTFSWKGRVDNIAAYNYAGLGFTPIANRASVHYEAAMI